MKIKYTQLLVDPLSKGTVNTDTVILLTNSKRIENGSNWKQHRHSQVVGAEGLSSDSEPGGTLNDIVYSILPFVDDV